MSVFPLPRSLSIRTIRDAHHTITESAGADEPLMLDGQEVRELDTCGVQLLAALLSTDGIAAPRATLSHPSEELADALQRAGLGTLLQHQANDNDTPTGRSS